MSHEVTRYECPDCGHQVDLNSFGTPHHSSLICIPCDRGMQQAKTADGGFTSLVEGRGSE